MAISQYKALDPAIGAGALSDIDTVKRFPLGYEVQAVRVATGSADTVPGWEAGVFKYAQGSNVASVGQFVHLSQGSAVLLAAANSASKFPAGVACAVLGATSQYGWVQVEGPCDYARGTNSSIAAGVPLYIAAGTAGILVTNVVAGNQVLGAVAPASYTSSQSNSLTLQLARPHLVGVSASI
jgi:hypothetical protein